MLYSLLCFLTGALVDLNPLGTDLPSIINHLAALWHILGFSYWLQLKRHCKQENMLNIPYLLKPSELMY